MYVHMKKKKKQYTENENFFTQLILNQFKLICTYKISFFFSFLDLFLLFPFFLYIHTYNKRTFYESTMTMTHIRTDFNFYIEAAAHEHY